MHVRNFLIKAAAGICVLFFGMALVFSLFTGPGTLGTPENNALASVMGMAVVAAAAVLLARFLPKEERKLRGISLGVAALMAAGLIASCLLFSCPFDVDLRYCHLAAIDLAQTGKIGFESYMAEYAHQQPITLLLGGLYALFMRLGFTDMTAVGEGFHALCILGCALCAQELAALLFSRRMGVLTLCLFAASPIFYLYAPRFYNDMPACLFSLLSALCAVRAYKARGIAKTLWALAAGLLAAAGIRLRVVVIMLLIAYAMTLFAIRGTRRAIKELLPLGLGLLAGLGICSLLLTRFGVADESVRFPFTHWLMMGARQDTYGFYSQQDYEMTRSISGVAQKMTVHLEEMKARYASLLGVDLLAHLIKKMTIVWSDGSFWVRQYLCRSENFGGLWEILYGVRSNGMMLLCRMVYACVLGGVVLRAVDFFRHPQKADAGFVFLLALAGGGAFYLIWEANWRYAFTFYPWMLLLAAQCAQKLNERLPCSAEFYRACRNGAACILSITLACACFFTGYYGHAPIEYTEEAAIQDLDIEAFEIGDEPLEQTLETDNAFDRVTLRFLSAGTGGEYILRVTGIRGGECLYERRFTSETAAQGNVVFVFPQPLERGAYRLSVACVKEQDQGTPLRAAAIARTDVYPRGVCTRGGEEIGNLYFHAQLLRYGTLYTAKHVAILFGIPAFFVALLIFALERLYRRARRRAVIRD